MRTKENIDQEIANLSEKKRSLLELMLRDKRREGPQLPIQRRPNPRSAPLSFAQQRVWFLQQLEPESSAYNLPGAFQLRGHLSIKALTGSFNEVVRRHEVLRTCFHLVNGEVRQIIGDTPVWVLSIVDLCEMPERARRESAERLIDREVRRGFDLVLGPILRATLVITGNDTYILFFASHHITMDGTSLTLKKREIGSLSGAYLKNEPPPLADLPIQYGD